MAHSTWLFWPQELGQPQEWATETVPSQKRPPGLVGELLLCSLGLMAEFLQSEQRRGTYRETALKAKLASSFPQMLRERAWNLDLSSLSLLRANPLQDTQIVGPVVSQMPTGAITLHMSPHP